MSYNFVAIQIGTLDGRNVGRSGHILNDCIQKLLNALVTICGTAAYRNCCTLAGCLTQYLLHLFYRRLFTFQVHHHQIVIQLTDLLDQLGTIQFCIILHIAKIIGNSDVITFIVIVDVSFHLEQIDDSLEIVFFADRQLKNDSIFTKSGLDLLYCAVEVSTQDVHLVDERHTRYVIGVSLTPYVLGLRLYTTLCTEDADSAIQYTKGTLNLNGEVYVTRGINDVDTMLQSSGHGFGLFFKSPVTGSSSRGDGNTSLLFLLHPVHGSSTFVSITNLVVNTSVIQDTLGQCGLTRIDMSHNTNISGSL